MNDHRNALNGAAARHQLAAGDPFQQNALRWKITGHRAHGNTARDILNAWSDTLMTVMGDADRFIAAGIYGALPHDAGAFGSRARDATIRSANCF